MKPAMFPASIQPSSSPDNASRWNPASIFRKKGIGVRIEDLVLITEDGCEVLNSYPKELTVLPFEE